MYTKRFRQLQLNKESKASANSGRLWCIFRTAVFWILFIIFLLQIVVAAYLHFDPRALVDKLPIRLLEVTSDSMYPKFRAGDGVVEVNTEFQKLKEGDIITFLQSGEMVTHEIIEVNDNGTVTTRGLATEISDHPVDASNYVGRVVLVLPGLSGFLSMSHGALRKTIWIILFGVILFGPELISKVYDLIYEKRK